MEKIKLSPNIAKSNSYFITEIKFYIRVYRPEKKTLIFHGQFKMFLQNNIFSHLYHCLCLSKFFIYITIFAIYSSVALPVHYLHCKLYVYIYSYIKLIMVIYTDPDVLTVNCEGLNYFLLVYIVVSCSWYNNININYKRFISKDH